MKMINKTMTSEFAKNDLRYSATKIVGNTKITVNIRLNDECKNGHQDFAITANGYEKSHNGGWKKSFGGCCHDEILKFWPEFRSFVDMHLNDRKGVPMYGVENGYYWLQKYQNKSKEAHVFQESLRLKDDEVVQFENCDDKEYFHYLLYKLNIVSRWEEEAKKAILQLETLIGGDVVFIDDSVKDNIVPLPDDKILEIEVRINEGYYSAESINAWKLAEIERKKQKRIKTLKANAESEIHKIQDKLQMNLCIVEAGLPDDNFIYYDHKKEGAFNWNDGSYCSRITQEQFDEFLSKVDYTKLPDGIKFTLKYK